MEITPPCASSPFAKHQDASSLDDHPVQHGLLLSDGLKVKITSSGKILGRVHSFALRNMRSQLYSAAKYFELSYINDERKEVVMRTLKEYAFKAIVNAVDHLGSVSYKVNNLLNKEIEEVSVAECEVSCIEQRIQTCQACTDQEGFSQQSLFIRPPKYHKNYIWKGDSLVDSSIQPMLKYVEGLYPPKEHRKQQRPPTGSETRHRPPPIPIRDVCSPSPSTSTPSLREQPLPPRHVRSISTLSQLEKVTSKGRRLPSPFQASNPLMRTRSVANRPTRPFSAKQYVLEPQNSLPINLGAERSNHKELERNPSKKKGFLKRLLKRSKSWTDDSLYSYLDEY